MARQFRACRRARRQDPQGRQARRPADRAADPVRIGRQYENGADAGADHPAIDPRPRRRGHRVNRRELMLLLAGAMTAARALRAQHQKATPVIGFLCSASPGPFAPFVAAFHQGLSDTGYVQGQNLTIEYRWAEGHYDRLPALATDLVDRKVDVIAATGGPL